MVTVRFVEIAADRIVNLTSPRCPAEIVQRWKGRHDWHDACYEPLRDEIERLYVGAFDDANGHYSRLEASVLKEGVRNPVMLVTGGVHRRKECELPPQWRGRKDAVISEYLGGSRIDIARRHGLAAPAIVNDFGNVFADARRIGTAAELLACFTDKPRRVEFNTERGAYVNDMPYAHMERGYSLAQQVTVRRAIMVEVTALVGKWLRDNEKT
jgi:hypothetical protein